jgi:hypothetical protein
MQARVCEVFYWGLYPSLALYIQTRYISVLRAKSFLFGHPKEYAKDFEKSTAGSMGREVGFRNDTSRILELKNMGHYKPQSRN